MPRKKKLEIVDKLDKKLLNLKSGDNFIVEMYLGGTRLCEIKMGYKYAKVKSLFGSPLSKKFSARKIKDLLAATYWCAARSDATYKAWEKGRKRKPRNWEAAYK